MAGEIPFGALPPLPGGPLPMGPAVPRTSYEPTDEEKEIVAEVDRKFAKYRQFRQPHEGEWYVNSAQLRGQQYTQWSATDQRMTTPNAPAHRVRLVVNRIQAKAKARRAKFLKNRPKPVVVPASSEFQDQLDARATTKTLEFQFNRLKQEKKYREALLWSEVCGKGYWWFYWDPALLGRVKMESQIPGGKPEIVEAELGDICLEVGSTYEVLVADPTIHTIGLQPEIMRVKLRQVDEVKARYPEFAEVIEADAGDTTSFMYEQRIGELNAAGTYGGSGTLEDRSTKSKPDMVLMKELFIRPNAAHPKGAYRLVAGKVLLKSEEELPYGFWDMQNPYPVVEFIDVETVGQYYSTTLIAQMIPIQREYNLVRSKVAEQLRIMAFPKLLAAKQHQIPKGAWTSEAGEFVEYLALPGIPPPQPWHPPAITADAWRTIELIKTEFDDITQVYPAAEGKVAGATSGFQTNLLQEATDLVHTPDLRSHELTMEDAQYKIRRMMKLGYTLPRLISVVGQHYTPEVFEFSQKEIDENATIVMQVGSMLPDLKAARIEAGMELFKSGVMGNPQDPAVRRRVLGLIDVGTIEETVDIARADEQQAKLENVRFEQTQQIKPAEFFEDHTTHYEVHTLKLKSSEAQLWPPQMRNALIAHAIAHLAFQNPQAALTLQMQYGLPPTPQTAALLQQPAPVAGGPAPPMQGPPAAGSPQGAPPGPPAPNAGGPPQDSSQA